MTDTLQRINEAAGNLYDQLGAKESTLVNETLLRNMERINAVAEVLFDLLYDNPKAQTLVEIIVEASQTNK